MDIGYSINSQLSVGLPPSFATDAMERRQLYEQYKEKHQQKEENRRPSSAATRPATPTSRPSSPHVGRPQSRSGSSTSSRVVMRNSKHRGPLQRFDETLFHLPKEAVAQPHSHVTALRLLKAQREVQKVAKAGAERHRAVTPDPIIDAMGSIHKHESLEDQPSPLMEAVDSHAGVLGASSTPLDPEVFSNGAKCRALFETWCHNSLEQSSDFSFVTVWAEMMAAQVKAQCVGLPPHNTFQALTSLTLLLKTLDGVLPVATKGLVFSLLDGVLDVVMEGWREAMDQLPAPALRPPHELSEPSIYDRNGQTASRIVAGETPDPGYITSVGAYRDTTLCARLIDGGNFGAVLTSGRLYAESAVESREAQANEFERAAKELDEKMLEESKKRELVLSEAQSSRTTFLRYTFNAWKGFVQQLNASRATASGVIDGMARQHNETRLRLTFHALRSNVEDNKARRKREANDAKIREWRVQEGEFQRQVSELKAKIATMTADHTRALDDAEERRWTEVNQIMTDTQQMREQHAGNVARIEQLEKDVEAARSDLHKWVVISNVQLREATGVHTTVLQGITPGAVRSLDGQKPGPPVCRVDPSLELLYDETAYMAPKITTGEGAAPKAVSPGSSPARRGSMRRSSFVKKAPLSPGSPEASPARRTSSAVATLDGNKSKIQLTPFTDIGDVVNSSMPAERILMLFCNLMLRRFQPHRRPIENLGVDLADAVVYVCILRAVYPDRVPPSSFDDHPTNGARAEFVCGVLSDVGLDGLISPADIVLGVSLKNMALVAILVESYAATTRLAAQSRKPSISVSEGEALDPSASVDGPTPDDNHAMRLMVVDAGDGPQALPVPLAALRENDSKLRSLITDPETMEKCSVATRHANRTWAFVSQFVVRETFRKLHSTRSRRGEMLDERSLRQMEWFLRTDELKVASLALLNPNNAPNETDKVDTALGSLYWEIRAVYQAYAASDGGVLMSQAGLLKLVKDAQLTKNLPKNALEEAYKFATTDDLTGNSLIFAPTAVGSVKKGLTPESADAVVTPFVFIHVLVHLASQQSLRRVDQQQKAMAKVEEARAAQRQKQESLLGQETDRTSVTSPLGTGRRSTVSPPRSGRASVVSPARSPKEGSISINNSGTMDRRQSTNLPGIPPAMLTLAHASPLEFNLHVMIRDLLANSTVPNALSSTADELRPRLRHPLVHRQFAPLTKWLVRAFAHYGENAAAPTMPTAAGSRAGSPAGRRGMGNDKKGQPTTPEDVGSITVSVDAFVRLAKDLRLVDQRVTAEDVADVYRCLLNVDDNRVVVAADGESQRRLQLRAMEDSIASPSPTLPPAGPGRRESPEQPTADAPVTPRAAARAIHGLGYQEFLDALAAVAAMRSPLPFHPPHVQVQRMIGDGNFLGRMKEVLK